MFEEAFDDLYTRAYGVAFQLLGRRSEAEDVAQETLARAFVRWRKIRSYAEAWVVRVAGNLAIDVWRRLRRVDTDAATERRGATAPGPNEQRIDLHRALDKLSRRQREVLDPALPRRPPRGRRGEGAGLLGGFGEAARQPRTRHPQDHDGQRRRRRHPGALMPNLTDSDLRDPSPPVPGDAERTAVAARAQQLGRRRRMMQGAGALGMVAAVAVGVAALTAGGASGPGAGTNRIEAASSPATTDTTDAVVTTTVPAPVTTVPAHRPAPAPAEGNAAVSEAPVPEPTVDTTPAPVEPAPSVFSVSGTVGNIPEGAVLTVTLRGGAGTFSGTADAAGYFSIGGVPTGEYQASYVWVAVDGTASQVMKLGTHLIDHNVDNLNFNLQ